MTTIKLGAVAAFAVLLPTLVMAQDSTTQFQLAPDSKNMASCNVLDQSMGRAHTVTVKGGQAVIKMAGGADDELKVVRPGVYQTELALSGVRVAVVADLSGAAKTLTATEKSRGCKWMATKS